jgi:hypothetical protein
MNAQEYYSRRKKIHAELKEKHGEHGSVLLVSVENLDKNSTAGNLCEVSVENAARCVVEGTHRLGTDEEYAAFRAQQQAAREAVAKETVERARNNFNALLGGQGPMPAPPPAPAAPQQKGK